MNDISEVSKFISASPNFHTDDEWCQVFDHINPTTIKLLCRKHREEYKEMEDDFPTLVKQNKLIKDGKYLEAAKLQVSFGPLIGRKQREKKEAEVAAKFQEFAELAALKARDTEICRAVLEQVEIENRISHETAATRVVAQKSTKREMGIEGCTGVVVDSGKGVEYPIQCHNHFDVPDDGRKHAHAHSCIKCCEIYTHEHVKHPEHVSKRFPLCCSKCRSAINRANVQADKGNFVDEADVHIVGVDSIDKRDGWTRDESFVMLEAPTSNLRGLLPIRVIAYESKIYGYDLEKPKSELESWRCGVDVVIEQTDVVLHKPQEIRKKSKRRNQANRVVQRLEDLGIFLGFTYREGDAHTGPTRDIGINMGECGVVILTRGVSHAMGFAESRSKAIVPRHGINFELGDIIEVSQNSRYFTTHIEKIELLPRDLQRIGIADAKFFYVPRLQLPLGEWMVHLYNGSTRVRPMEIIPFESGQHYRCGDEHWFLPNGIRYICDVAPGDSGALVVIDQKVVGLHVSGDVNGAFGIASEYPMQLLPHTNVISCDNYIGHGRLKSLTDWDRDALQLFITTVVDYIPPRPKYGVVTHLSDLIGNRYSTLSTGGRKVLKDILEGHYRLDPVVSFISDNAGIFREFENDMQIDRVCKHGRVDHKCLKPNGIVRIKCKCGAFRVVSTCQECEKTYKANAKILRASEPGCLCTGNILPGKSVRKCRGCSVVVLTINLEESRFRQLTQYELENWNEKVGFEEHVVVRKPLRSTTQHCSLMMTSDEDQIPIYHVNGAPDFEYTNRQVLYDALCRFCVQRRPRLSLKAKQDIVAVRDDLCEKLIQRAKNKTVVMDGFHRYKSDDCYLQHIIDNCKDNPTVFAMFMSIQRVMRNNMVLQDVLYHVPMKCVPVRKMCNKELFVQYGRIIDRHIARCTGCLIEFVTTKEVLNANQLGLSVYDPRDHLMCTTLVATHACVSRIGFVTVVCVICGNIKRRSVCNLCRDQTLNDNMNSVFTEDKVFCDHSIQARAWQGGHVCVDGMPGFLVCSDCQLGVFDLYCQACVSVPFPLIFTDTDCKVMEIRPVQSLTRTMDMVCEGDYANFRIVL